MAPEICPNCGADVKPKAKACPECGACEETGWSEEAGTSGLDLPDEEFDYSEFVKKEFGNEEPKPRSISWFWWIVGLAVVAALLAMIFR